MDFKDITYTFLRDFELAEVRIAQSGITAEQEGIEHMAHGLLFHLDRFQLLQLTPENFIRVNGKRWLYFKSVKTGVEIRLPLHLLFESRVAQV